MAACSLQPAGRVRLLIHPVPSSGSAPQQLFLENSRFVGSISLLDALHLRGARQELRSRQVSCDPKQGWDKNHFRSRNFKHRESELRPPQPTSNSSLPLNPGPVRVARYGVQVTAETVSKLCENGLLSEAVDALGALVQTECRVSISLFHIVLKSCVARKNLVLGRRVHELTVKDGCESNTFLANHILRMYTSHGRLQEAKDVFTRVAKPDAFSWSALITGYVKHGEPKQAIKLYQQMLSSCVKPDNHVFVAALQACASAADLESGRQVHADVLESGIPPDLFVWNCLIDMYAKCDKLDDAHRIFDSLPTKDVVTWTAMIAGYAEHGLGQRALALYNKMEEEGLILANSVTFACLLRACATVGALQQGKQLHSQILERGLGVDIFVSNNLVEMYAKCGRLEEARRVFDSLSTRDVVTWNAMIAGYAEHGLGQEALALYGRMKQEGVITASHVTFACLLKACATVGAFQQGKQLHSEILEKGLKIDMLVGNSLVDMYAKCGNLREARRVFDCLASKDVVTWTAMIAGYVEHGHGEEALALHDIMDQEGLNLSGPATFASLLKACANSGAIEQGRQLHSQIIERGLESEIVVGTCLVDMYAKCGSLKDAFRTFESLARKNVVTYNTMISGYANCGKLEDARKLFDSLSVKDVVTWNAMIAGYAGHGLVQESLVLYGRMEQEDMIPADSCTFVCLLKACATTAALQQGKQLHAKIVERRLGSDTVIGTCLVDMYAKCGRLEDARKVFDSLPTKDVASWNAMINGFGQSNEGHKAIGCFEEMMQGAVQPNETTFTCLLVACSHEGLVKEGLKFFEAMAEGHGVMPTVEHYNCLVDLLGRAGRLDEAGKMLVSWETNDVGFRSLLNACRSHGNIELGTRCFENLIRADSQNAAAYVLMGKIYADAGRWSDVERIDRLRKLAGAVKKPAVAGIEVDRHVHTFVVGEERGDVSSRIQSMNTRLRVEGGHVPHTELVLKQVPEKKKEEELCGHAEKLALAYGLMNTPNGTSLLVTKNLRMCSDCHSSTEIISRIEKREIIVRDAFRLHRFVDGSCCCGGRP